jgi:hypothetical protein
MSNIRNSVSSATRSLNENLSMPGWGSRTAGMLTPRRRIAVIPIGFSAARA